MRIEDFRLGVSDLVQKENGALKDFKTTEELDPLDEIIGQNRGMKALEFGLNICGDGYNCFVLGPQGSGRASAVRTTLQSVAKEKPVPDDWCYVNNFSESHRPIAINLPAGKGREFSKDIAELMEEISRQLSAVFESESFQRRHDEIAEKLQDAQNSQFARLQEKAREAGFLVQRSGNMFGIVPMKEGKALIREEFEQLPDEEKAELEEKGKGIRQELNEAMKAARQAEREARDSLQELDRKVASMAVETAINEIKEKYAEFEKIGRYLADVREHVISNVREFVGDQGEDKHLPFPMPSFGDQDKGESKFEVNLLVDNGREEGAPVVIESNPTYANLIGRTEHKPAFGGLVTDFTMLKPGALQRANGGYLVLQARDLLMNFMSWPALKRCLKDKRVKIEDLNEQYRLFATVSLQPEPIPLDLKVILIGEPFIFYLLHMLDEDFSKLFKVKVDFDNLIDRTDENELTWARFIARRCSDENMRPFDAGAVSRIIEYSSRMAGDRNKLTAMLSGVADLARESSFWAHKNNNGAVTADDVDKAIDEKIYRSNRIEERLRELITDGTIMIDVEGEKIGQINGLAVLGMADYSFGKPSRITARAFAGRGGVVNIDREAKLAGRIHNKGVMILSGYLGGRYARNKPLSLSATICFEQVYDEIEGDSASAAEFYALLSAVGELPIKQSIAVTGSVNQHGDIQPIGGATQKVEGFFDICRATGLTGGQGVIVPRKNIRHLTLRPDLLKAVEEGKFHIYAVSTIEEGFAILSGMEPGERGEDGKFPEGTFNRRIDDSLDEFAKAWRQYNKGEEKPAEKNNSEENGNQS